MKFSSAVRSIAACAIVAAASVATPTAFAASTSEMLADMTGSWRGSGSVRLKTGRTERIRCQGNVSRPSTNAISHSLNCAGTDQTFSIRTSMRVVGDKVSGSFSESSSGINGGISGRSTGNSLDLRLASGGESGSLKVGVRKCSQSFRFSAGAGEVRNVSVTLKKNC